MIIINDTDQQMLLLAAETLKLYCKGATCNDCLFMTKKNNFCDIEAPGCGIRGAVPAYWRITDDKES